MKLPDRPLVEPDDHAIAHDRNERVRELQEAAGRCLCLIAVAVNVTPRAAASGLRRLLVDDDQWIDADRAEFVDAYAETLAGSPS